MLTTDLGPLEQAILTAVVGAEALGLPQDSATLHRLLPSYRTHEGNVVAALAEGRPLRQWLLAAGPYFVLRDRADSAVVVSAGRRRAKAAWQERSGAVRGLSKLPWVEAVAAVGPFSQGFLPSIDRPLDLVVIAEGGRTDLARGALGLFRRASRSGEAGLRVLAVLDSDALSLTPLGPLDALLWASLQPVVGAAAWGEFRAANSWLKQRFPNSYSVQPEVPGLVSSLRLDGRLAGLRRRRIGDSTGQELMRSERRKGGLLGRLEERAAGRLGSGVDVGILGALDSSAVPDFEARIEAVRAWAFEIESPVEIEARAAVDEAVEEAVAEEAVAEEAVAEVAEEVVSVEVETDEEVEAPEDEQQHVTVRGSRRAREDTHRTSARRAASSPEKGQSRRGQGRRRAGRRSTSK